MCDAVILRMEVLPCILLLCDHEKERLAVHEMALGLTVQLAKGDYSCEPLFRQQTSTAGILAMMARFPDAADVQADGARVLASLVSSEAAVLTFVSEDGLAQLLAVSDAFGEESAVRNEVANVLEQAVCAMCSAIEDDPPEDELDAKAMVELLKKVCIVHTAHLCVSPHTLVPRIPAPLSDVLLCHPMLSSHRCQTMPRNESACSRRRGNGLRNRQRG